MVRLKANQVYRLSFVAFYYAVFYTLTQEICRGTRVHTIRNFGQVKTALKSVMDVTLCVKVEHLIKQRPHYPLRFTQLQ